MVLPVHVFQSGQSHNSQSGLSGESQLTQSRVSPVRACPPAARAASAAAARGAQARSGRAGGRTRKSSRPGRRGDAEVYKFFFSGAAVLDRTIHDTMVIRWTPKDIAPNTARQHRSSVRSGRRGVGRGIGYENWAPRSRSGRVGSGLKQVQEIQCRFRENTPPSDPDRDLRGQPLRGP